MLLPRCSARSPVDSVSTMVGIGIAADLLEPSLRAGPAPTEGPCPDFSTRSPTVTAASIPHESTQRLEASGRGPASETLAWDHRRSAARESPITHTP